MIVPDYSEGTYEIGDAFLLCSDGFRHILPPEEIEKGVKKGCETEEQMQLRLVEITERSKEGGEKDNISAILIRVGQGGRFL